jgi:response regulator RpfG family c-di-GMP phosphodiesterase
MISTSRSGTRPDLESDPLESTVIGIVHVLTDVLGMVAPEALGRGQRLRDCMRKFAADLEAEAHWELEIAALLSPIGYASLPTSVLQKLRADFTPEEKEIEQRVPQISHDLLIQVPRLSEAAEIVLYQHKYFDGSGFPEDNRAGDAIPVGARMLKILIDRLELESDGVVQQQAHDAMRARPGRYDPKLLDRCFASFPKFLESAVTGDHPILTLPLAALRAGQVVVADICTHDGVILVGAGSRLAPMTLVRLRNYGELHTVREPICVQDSPVDPLAA